MRKLSLLKNICLKIDISIKELYIDDNNFAFIFVIIKERGWGYEL